MQNTGTVSAIYNDERRCLVVLQFLANGVCSASVICLVALGFGVIYYVNRILHIAHGAVIVIAGYATYYAVVSLKLSVIFSAAISILAAATVGILIEVIVYKPLVRRKASGSVILVSSLGVYIILINLVAMIFGSDRKILRPGVEKTIEFANVILTHVQVAQVVMALLVTFFLYIFLFRTRYGRLGRAIADNDTLASVLGMNVEAVRVSTAAIGSALAGLGAFMAALHTGIDPNMGFPIVLAAAVACIIGGIGNFLAPVLGALFIGILENLTIWQLSSKWSNAMTFCLLILFLLFRPQGFLGTQRRITET